MTSKQTVLLNEIELNSTIDKLVSEIADSPWDKPVALVGLLSRGDMLAKRIAKKLENEGKELSLGYLDISLYRDDLGSGANPMLRSSHLPFSLDGTRIILVDDVLYTGRTIRAALNAIMDYGRPSKIELAVLIDRGGREMPIQPDYLGYSSPHPGTQVRVSLFESDGLDCVVLD